MCTPTSKSSKIPNKHINLKMLCSNRIPTPFVLRQSLLLPNRGTFNIFINDPSYGTECAFIKFAEDNKMGGVADRPDGCVIKRHLDRLEK